MCDICLHQTNMFPYIWKPRFAGEGICPAWQHRMLFVTYFTSIKKNCSFSDLTIALHQIVIVIIFWLVLQS